jgi:hypothetical protein
MADMRAKIKGQQNALERLRDRIPGFRDYYDREARREADRVLRNYGVDQLENAARDVQEIVKRTPLAGIRPYQDLIKTIEWLTNQIRHADQGYSGFFDEVKWDSPEVLDALYRQDEEIVEAVTDLAGRISAGEFDPAAIDGELRALQRRFADRKNRILGLARS